MLKCQNRAAVTGINYPAALSIIVPYPAPCGAAAPAVPAVRYCKRFLGLINILPGFYPKGDFGRYLQGRDFIYKRLQNFSG